MIKTMCWHSSIVGRVKIGHIDEWGKILTSYMLTNYTRIEMVGNWAGDSCAQLEEISQRLPWQCCLIHSSEQSNVCLPFVLFAFTYCIIR